MDYNNSEFYGRLQNLEDQLNTLTNKVDFLYDQDHIQERELNRMSLFNTNANQAYLNQQVDNQAFIDRLNKLEKQLESLQERYIQNINDIKQDINTTKTTVSNITEYLDDIDDNLDKYDICFKDFARENEMVLGALIRLKQEFDAYAEAEFKEKIITHANFIAITYELLAHGFIDGQTYVKNIQTVVQQIADAYNAEGIPINLDEELKLFSESINGNKVTLQMPTIMRTSSQKNASQDKSVKKKATASTKKKQSNENKNEDEDNDEVDNVIDFSQVLNQQQNQPNFNISAKIVSPTSDSDEEIEEADNIDDLLIASAEELSKALDEHLKDLPNSKKGRNKKK